VIMSSLGPNQSLAGVGSRNSSQRIANPTAISEFGNSNAPAENGLPGGSSSGGGQPLGDDIQVCCVCV
jgi:hypothetical protein